MSQTANYQPGRTWRTWLIGRPLATADAPHQTIGRLVGLAVFASDALSSTAYATQEIMVILAAAGAMAFGLVFPIALAIVGLLAIVTLSYEQTIHAYPGGGGAYIVARDNLGELPAQTAGAALLTDYILTVAVSISSGVAQLTSAFPALLPYAWRDRSAWFSYHVDEPARRQGIRPGVRHPDLFLILMMYATVGTAMVRFLTGSLGQVIDPPMDAARGVAHDHAIPDPACLLQRYGGSHGRGSHLQRHHGLSRTAQPERGHHPDLDGVHPGFALSGHLVPGGPDRRDAIGSRDGDLTARPHGLQWSRGLYLATIASTTLILIMAANTSFADFPRLGALTPATASCPNS